MIELNKDHLDLLQALELQPLTKEAFQRGGCHGNWLVTSGLVVKVGGIYHITDAGCRELAERLSPKLTQDQANMLRVFRVAKYYTIAVGTKPIPAFTKLMRAKLVKLYCVTNGVKYYTLTPSGEQWIKRDRYPKDTKIAFDKAAMPEGPVDLKFKVPKGSLPLIAIKDRTLRRLLDAAVAYGTTPRDKSLDDLVKDLRNAAQALADEVNRGL